MSVNSFYLEKVHSFTAKWPQRGVIYCQPNKKLMSRFVAFFSANLRATDAGNFESKGSHKVGEVVRSLRSDLPCMGSLRPCCSDSQISQSNQINSTKITTLGSLWVFFL